MSYVDRTQRLEKLAVRDAVRYFVTTQKGARGDGRVSSISSPFYRMMYSKLLYAPIEEILNWQASLKAVTDYLNERRLDDVGFWTVGRDLMDGLTEPLGKGMTRNSWSRVIALYTYHELESCFQQLITKATDGPLARAQAAWNEQYEKFRFLNGAIDRGIIIPQEMATALGDFYQSDAKHRLPAALAFFLAMRTIETNPLYGQYISARADLGLYRAVLQGANVEAKDDLALQYVLDLRRGGAPIPSPLHHQPNPFVKPPDKQKLVLYGGCLVFGAMCTVIAILVALAKYGDQLKEMAQ